MLHGTVADPQLAGLDPRQRAVLVLERNKAGLVHNAEKTAEEVLADTARAAQVSLPETASVVSLRVLSNMESVRVSTVPKPVSGPANRPPAVAGSFYDADVQELTRTVDRLLAGEHRPEHWPAAMVPHAGLKYSGAVAAAVLKRIQIPKTVIVIGPKHTALGVDCAVAGHQAWQLPGGVIESDTKLARELCQAIPGLELDAAAHEREHAIEVELPLLARLAPESKVVGIVIGHGDLSSARRFGQGLANLLRERDDRPLLLISSDMNHFAPDADNRLLDELALAALDRCDPEELYEKVTENNISMCGVLPAIIVLETLKLLDGGRKSERVAYATTADVTGDASRVVGYAGMLFS
jgi:AmmeMemoRadiSam system protein B